MLTEISADTCATATETESFLYDPAYRPQSFLNDPAHKIDTFYTSEEFQPYKDNTGRQLRHLLIHGTWRWAITAVMCFCYAAATIIWQNKHAQGETSKRMYNTITTGVSIALGLNLQSAFKDMALNMRWVILSNRKRNLIEVRDLSCRQTKCLQLSRWTSFYAQTRCKDWPSSSL